MFRVTRNNVPGNDSIVRKKAIKKINFDQLNSEPQALTCDQEVSLKVVRLSPSQEYVRLVDQNERIPCLCQIEPVLDFGL